MYRIVHNELTESYRVERRGLFGWAFVSDRQTGDYLQFDSLRAAQTWIRQNSRRASDSARRWKVVAQCSD